MDNGGACADAWPRDSTIRAISELTDPDLHVTAPVRTVPIRNAPECAQEAAHGEVGGGGRTAQQAPGR
jgi:hypothetical protein